MQSVITPILDKFETLQPDEDWSFRDAGRSQTNHLTHAYHRYPAKFIPQIVDKLIQTHAPDGNEVICDPFGGCGTTFVEAKLLGHTSIGFDINPVAKLIAQTKTTPIEPRALQKGLGKFLEYYKTANPSDSERHERIKYWFDEETAKELDRIYFAIKKIRDYKVRRFFLCAFSHNLKNCSRWLMKSIKPTIDKNKTPPDPLKSFERHLQSMIKRNKKFYLKLGESGYQDVPMKMYRRDSTKKLPLDSSSIDLIVTSPPYVTSYEYADLHQLSLIWFGSDPEYFKQWNRFSDEFADFRRKFVGTMSKRAKRGNYGSDIAETIVNELSEVKQSLASDVKNYFLDMKRAFAEMYRILKPGGKACIIIGNTSLLGVEILNAQVAVEQMQQAGFIEGEGEYIKREIPNKMITPWRDSETGKFTGMNNPSKTRAYEYEYVIVMEKP